MSMSADGFHWADWLVFAVCLLVSVCIGLWFALRGGRQKTQSEYFRGDRHMSVLPVAISMAVSFISAITVLGVPIEVYAHGTQYWMYLLGYASSIVFTCLLLLPLHYKLNYTSCYEYLEKRFKRKIVRLVATLLLILSQILWSGFAIYTPAMALGTVTQFPVWASISLMGCVCVLYTSIGGLKAVVITDVFQASVMVAGLLVIIIAGCVEVGGIQRVYQSSIDWDRIEFFNFDTDPTTRHTFWSLVVSTTISGVALFGSNQVAVQRYCSVSTMNKARLSLFLYIPIAGIFKTLATLAGLVIFAYYANQECDPVRSGILKSSNQVVPHFIMEVLGYPGLPGLFVSCLFGAALSTVSSTLNGLAAVSWEDFLKSTCATKSATFKMTATKLLVVFYGCLATGFAYLCGALSGTILQAAMSFVGISASPLGGMFLLGALFPCANWIGAVVGAGFGLLPMWFSIGAYSLHFGVPMLDTPIGNCTLAQQNFTLPSPRTRESIHGIEKLYTISYLWLPALGVLITIIVGLFVSCLTGFTQVEEVNPDFLVPVADRLTPCLPEKTLRVWRCREKKTSDKNKVEQTQQEEYKTEYMESVWTGEEIVTLKSAPAGYKNENDNTLL